VDTQITHQWQSLGSNPRQRKEL